MKTLILISLLFPVTWSISQIPQNGLIACYDFESNTNDAVNAYNGTLLGGATVTTTLNTGGNAMDALSIPGNMLTNATEFSIAVKVRFTNFNVSNQSASNTIFSGASPTEDNLMLMSYAKDQLPGGSATLQNTVFYLHENIRYEFNNINLTAGQWYHFTIVRGANSLKFYLDGIEQSPLGGHTMPILNLTLDPNGFIFGQDQDVLGGGFAEFQSLNGSLDDLIIYNRALTDQEVQDISNFDHSTLSVSNESLNKQILLHPNPANDFVQIAMDESITILDNAVELHDLSGCKMIKNLNTSGLIDVSDLSAGIYFLVIQDTSGEKIVSRFQKK